MFIITQQRKITAKQNGNMEQKTLNLNNVKNIAAKASAEKGKLLVAIVLIAVMAFMWVKVFSGKSTVTKAAASAVAAQQDVVQRTITYVSLPVAAGRNDTLKRNVFDRDDFGGKNAGAGDVTGGGGMGMHKANIAKIAKTIKLNAIITGEKPAAFIDSQLATVGSVLNLRCDGQLYEFVVTKITENTALLSWEDFSITVRMVQPRSTE
jgi:hypothetical protein